MPHFSLAFTLEFGPSGRFLAKLPAVKAATEGLFRT